MLCAVVYKILVGAFNLSKMAQLSEEDQVKLREAFQNYEIAGTSSIKSEDLAALLRALKVTIITGIVPSKLQLTTTSRKAKIT